MRSLQRIRFAVCVVVIAFASGLLMSGCKKNTSGPNPNAILLSGPLSALVGNWSTVVTHNVQNELVLLGDNGGLCGDEVFDEFITVNFTQLSATTFRMTTILETGEAIQVQANLIGNQLIFLYDFQDGETPQERTTSQVTLTFTQSEEGGGKTDRFNGAANYNFTSPGFSCSGQDRWEGFKIPDSSPTKDE